MDSSSSLRHAGKGTVAFLTTATLLTMQLRDATFRRQVLTEVMMLLYRGTRHHAEGKEVPEKMVRTCEELLPRVRSALQATGTLGPAFTGALQRSTDPRCSTPWTVRSTACLPRAVQRPGCMLSARP